MFSSNCYVTIFRGATVNERGDEQDAQNAIAKGVPASVLEKTLVSKTPEDNRVMQVTYGQGMVPIRQDIRKGDRIQVESSGRMWLVDSVAGGDLPMLQTPKVLGLRAIG